jgi:eukaryotic-like serine/threonine-protein kinase
MADPCGSESGSAQHFSSIGAAGFRAGDILGGRYEIQQLLGQGGMGAVYKARDKEVDRIVGLKVIRPDLARDPAILARFKQELVLARQVTHRNIIRIYDLNEASGVKFITMEFIEGEDLRSVLLREGKLSQKEAVGIILQVCAGLQAAHGEGVIHRDLKPSNIMRHGAGRVVVMDFGLARTVVGDGMTRTGMMLGTIEYMSPEQAMAKELDARSDQFAVGLIFYELLSGSMPYRADSAVASLVKRTHERAVPLTDVDSSIPQELSQIVSKCLELDPAGRFSSMQELIDELEIWEGKKQRAGQSAIAPPVPKPASTKRFLIKLIAAGVAVVALAAGIYVAVHNRMQTESAGTGQQAMKGPVMVVAVLPFYNGSGDAALDWTGATISDSLISDIGQSAHSHLISSGRLQDALRDLRISPAPQMDTSTLRGIKEATGAETVISGELVRAGDQFRINASVHDLKNGRDIPVSTDAASLKDLPQAVAKLAGQLREKLAATPDILKELQAGAAHVLTDSVSALQAYEEGLQLARAGDNTRAAGKFETATTEDPNFAIAFAKLAETYSTLGNDGKAKQASRRAVDMSGNLPARDRYLIEANHDRVMHETDKAIAAYENLTKVSPGDTDAQFALALLYEGVSRYDDARKRLDNVLAADPKYLDALYGRGRVEIKDGKPDAALDFLNKGLSLAVKLDNKQEKGNILNALGVAYAGLDKPDDALSSYQQALDIRKSVGDERGAEMTLSNIAGIQDHMGNAKAALANYQTAIDVARKIGDKNGLALNLMNLGAFQDDHGNYDEALKLTRQALQIYREIDDKGNQAQCLNNIGSALHSKGQYQDALTNFDQAYQISDQLKLQDVAAQALRNSGEMNFMLGQYGAAEAQFIKALTVSKAADDKTMVALGSNALGNLFAAQGEYDKALGAFDDAAKGLQQVKDLTWYSVDALASYGDVLSVVGRGAEGQKYIDEALKLAAQVKAPSGSTAEVLNSLGDSYFYRGDYSSARQQYQQALQVAGRTLNPQGLRARLGLARVDVEQGRAQAEAPALKKIMQDAGSMGLKALSVEASIFYAEALLAAHRADAARQQLEDALGQAEGLGMREELARAHYLLAKAGKPKEAEPHFKEAARILQSLSTQAGASHILDRPDLKAIYSEAKSSQGGAA